MIKKIKRLIKEFFQDKKQIHIKLVELQKQFNELEWAHIYHDSIRGKEWLEKLPLNVGRWAGNYTFFYVLNRVLNDAKPKSILELGLGESSKFITTYIQNELFYTQHDIIEQDINWVEYFKKQFVLSNNSRIEVCPLIQKEILGYNVNSYKNIDNKINKLYDFYLVDGPFGSHNYSRYDIIPIVEQFPKEHQFVLLLDDYNRKGEQQTANEIKRILNDKRILYTATTYTGNKALLLIATEKYKHLSSL